MKAVGEAGRLLHLFNGSQPTRGRRGSGGQTRGAVVASVAGAGACAGIGTIDGTGSIEALFTARGATSAGGGVGRRPGPGFNGGGFHPTLGLDVGRNN
jgi:hypothetical protein